MDGAKVRFSGLTWPCTCERRISIVIHRCRTNTVASSGAARTPTETPSLRVYFLDSSGVRLPRWLRSSGVFLDSPMSENRKLSRAGITLELVPRGLRRLSINTYFFFYFLLPPRDIARLVRVFRSGVRRVLFEARIFDSLYEQRTNFFLLISFLATIIVSKVSNFCLLRFRFIRFSSRIMC